MNSMMGRGIEDELNGRVHLFNQVGVNPELVNEIDSVMKHVQLR